jgi:hypothetical protein
VPQAPGTRAERFAAEFEAALRDFIELVGSLTVEEWRLVGQNYPQRMNGEDEGRTVGVIADHVADAGPMILGRIQAVLDGRPPPPLDQRADNARHAAERVGVTSEQVIARLRASTAPIADALRAIPDDRLDLSVDTPVGPMTVAQRIERVLIGHVRYHLGSIQAALAEARGANPGP